MSFDWVGFVGMLAVLTTGFVVGIIANAIIWIVIPFGEYIIKGLHYGVFIMILAGVLILPAMFIPFAPVVGMTLLLMFITMIGYVILYVVDAVF